MIQKKTSSNDINKIIFVVIVQRVEKKEKFKKKKNWNYGER